MEMEMEIGRGVTSCITTTAPAIGKAVNRMTVAIGVAPKIAWNSSHARMTITLLMLGLLGMTSVAPVSWLTPATCPTI